MNEYKNNDKYMLILKPTCHHLVHIEVPLSSCWLVNCNASLISCTRFF